jgi:murein endopeptidase
VEDERAVGEAARPGRMQAAGARARIEALVVQLTVDRVSADLTRMQVAPERGQPVVVGASAEGTGPMPGGQRRRLVEKEQLGEAAGLEQGSALPAAELQPAGDPAPDGVTGPDAALLVVEAAAVAVDETARGVGDQLAERRYAVLTRHLTSFSSYYRPRIKEGSVLPRGRVATLGILAAVLAALAVSAGVSAETGSRSLGLPWEGHLAGGVQLESAGEHFFTWDGVGERKPNRDWRRYGNLRLVSTLLHVLGEYALANPDAPRVGVGDLSRPNGGEFGRRFGGAGHASHQNGLDVDVFYPRLDRRERPPRVPRQIDSRLAQDLVERFVAAGAVKVFVGPSTGLTGPPAVVEVLPAHHDNHMHVRLPGDGVRSESVGGSTLGLPIRAFALGSGGPRVLVIGCIHGNECAGSVVANRLLHARPPEHGAIWVVQDVNPDGHARLRRANARGVDLNRNFPGTWRRLRASGSAPASEVETQLAMRLIRRLRPDVTIWFHQPQALVRASGGSVDIARRFARLARMRFRRLPWPPGSATAWQHAALPRSRAFVVELARGELGIREAGRYARAVLRLAESSG